MRWGEQYRDALFATSSKFAENDIFLDESSTHCEICDQGGTCMGTEYV